MFIYCCIGILNILILCNREYYKLTFELILKDCVKFKHNFDKIPKHNTIFLVNYPITSLEFAVPTILPVKTYFVSNYKAGPFLDLVYSKNDYILLKEGNNYDYFMKTIEKKIKKRSIYLYVEKFIWFEVLRTYKHNRITDENVGKIRSGIFYIAKKLGLTITPIVVDSLNLDKNFEVRIGQTTKVINPTQSIKDVKNFFFKTKKEFLTNK